MAGTVATMAAPSVAAMPSIASRRDMSFLVASVPAGFSDFLDNANLRSGTVTEL
jgi:hypothetical protein